MKKAFTMIELVLVIVIVGIISAVIVPQIGKTSLDRCAQQVLHHIRYTQHLAMMDNKFDPNDSAWYKKRWQIRFQYTGSSPRKYYYTIYSDKDKSNVYAQDEIAKNPLNTKQLLTGDKNISTSSGKYTKNMYIYKAYGIKSVSLSGCIQGGVSGSLRVAFDYFGRPIVKNIYSLDTPYIEKNTNEIRLMTKQCTITLTDSEGDSRKIVIMPETGYSYIED